MPSSALTFCERGSELSQLINTFDSITHESGPRLSVIAGERGTGKTRLALEFYRALASREHQLYWPDADSLIGDTLELNPSPDACRFDQDMPFLWWGIRAPDPDIRGRVLGDAVGDHHAYLAHHLVPLMVNARRTEMGWSLAKSWGELGVSALAGILQIDTILGIGEKILESVEIVNARSRTEDVAAGMEQSRRNRTAAILNDLSTVFDRQMRAGTAIPMVFLIDDAQFAHLDPSLFGLIRELLLRAELERWPLHLVATHWQRELATDADGDGTFAHLLRSLSPVWGQDRVIALGVLEDLTVALHDRLPGLTEPQAQAILERVGGNPRFLEQMIALATERISYFVGRDKNNALSDKGVRTLLERSFDIERVVEERLFGAPEEVQEALACASTQGMRFSKLLADAIGESLTGRSTHTGMARAHNPYALVFDAPGLAKQFGVFSEKLFYRAILELRDELPGVPDGGEAFDEALRERLKELLTYDAVVGAQDEKYPIDFFCELAINVFNRDTPEDWGVAAESRALLASFDSGRGNLERFNQSLSDLAKQCLEQPGGSYFKALISVFSVSPLVSEEHALLVFPEFARWVSNQPINTAPAFDRSMATALIKGWAGFVYSYSARADDAERAFAECLDALSRAYSHQPRHEFKMVIANAFLTIGGQVNLTSSGIEANAPYVETGLQIARDMHTSQNDLPSAGLYLRALFTWLLNQNFDIADSELLSQRLDQAHQVIESFGADSSVARAYKIYLALPESKRLVANKEFSRADDYLKAIGDQIDDLTEHTDDYLAGAILLQIFAVQLGNSAELARQNKRYHRDAVIRSRDVAQGLLAQQAGSYSDRLASVGFHLTAAGYDHTLNLYPQALAEIEQGETLMDSLTLVTGMDVVLVTLKEAMLLLKIAVYRDTQQSLSALNAFDELIELHEQKWSLSDQPGSFQSYIELLDRLQDARRVAKSGDLANFEHQYHLAQLGLLPQIVINDNNAKLVRKKMELGLASYHQLPANDKVTRLEFLDQLTTLADCIYQFTKQDDDKGFVDKIDLLSQQEHSR